ncbi:hypothetical protein ACVNP0_10435 [Staphylococcus aureus]
MLDRCEIMLSESKKHIFKSCHRGTGPSGAMGINAHPEFGDKVAHYISKYGSSICIF